MTNSEHEAVHFLSLRQTELVVPFQMSRVWRSSIHGSTNIRKSDCALQRVTGILCEHSSTHVKLGGQSREER